MAEKNVQEMITEVIESLNDEQKARLAECKTAEELIAFAGKEGIELPDELLDSVAGGYIYSINGGYDIVKDSDGSLMGHVNSRGEAEYLAERWGQSKNVIYKNELEQLQKGEAVSIPKCR